MSIVHSCSVLKCLHGSVSWPDLAQHVPARVLSGRCTSYATVLHSIWNWLPPHFVDCLHIWHVVSIPNWKLKCSCCMCHFLIDNPRNFKWWHHSPSAGILQAWGNLGRPLFFTALRWTTRHYSCATEASVSVTSWDSSLTLSQIATFIGTPNSRNNNSFISWVIQDASRIVGDPSTPTTIARQRWWPSCCWVPFSSLGRAVSGGDSQCGRMQHLFISPSWTSIETSWNIP